MKRIVTFSLALCLAVTGACAGVALATQMENEKLRKQIIHIEAQAKMNTALPWHSLRNEARLGVRKMLLEARLARLEKAILHESEREATLTD